MAKTKKKAAKKKTKALTVVDGGELESSSVEALTVPQEKRALVKQQIMKGASDAELDVFIGVCNRMRLDPFARQICAIQYGRQWSYQVTIDGFRVIAERTGKYEGQPPTQWCGPDAKWVDVWLSNKPPAAARVGVYRRGFRDPVYAVALWKSYAKSGGVWGQMGEHMLAKCAEALALRKAFPNDLGGQYTNDEIDRPQVTPLTTTSSPAPKKELPPPAPEASAKEVEEAQTRRTKDFDEILSWIKDAKSKEELGAVIDDAAELQGEEMGLARAAYAAKRDELAGRPPPPSDDDLDEQYAAALARDG